MRMILMRSPPGMNRGGSIFDNDPHLFDSSNLVDLQLGGSSRKWILRIAGMYNI